MRSIVRGRSARGLKHVEAVATAAASRERKHRGPRSGKDKNSDSNETHGTPDDTEIAKAFAVLARSGRIASVPDPNAGGSSVAPPQRAPARKEDGRHRSGNYYDSPTDYSPHRRGEHGHYPPSGHGSDSSEGGSSFSTESSSDSRDGRSRGRQERRFSSSQSNSPARRRVSDDDTRRKGKSRNRKKHKCGVRGKGKHRGASRGSRKRDRSGGRSRKRKDRSWSESTDDHRNHRKRPHRDDGRSSHARSRRDERYGDGEGHLDHDRDGRIGHKRDEHDRGNRGGAKNRSSKGKGKHRHCSGESTRQGRTVAGTNQSTQSDEQQQYEEWCSYIKRIRRPTFRDIRCAVRAYRTLQAYCATPGAPSLNAINLTCTAPGASGSTIKRWMGLVDKYPDYKDEDFFSTVKGETKGPSPTENPES